MERKRFLRLGCACGMLPFAGAAALQGQEQASGHVPQDMNHDQVKNILKYIDTISDESVKQHIFGRLGYECFYSRNLDQWIGAYTDDVQAFLDWVNVEKKTRYLERLAFNDDRTTLTLTGKTVRGCACAFSDCIDPP